MQLARRADLDPYVTKDGSTIREWAGPGYAAAASNQSVAEATVPPGASTAAHHERAEEIYLVSAGRGLLRIGEEECEIKPGDCATIPPGAVHQLRNTGVGDLVVVCCSSPPYSHEDTVLVE